MKLVAFEEKEEYVRAGGRSVDKENTQYLANAARLRETASTVALNFSGSEVWKMHVCLPQSSTSQDFTLTA